MAEIPSDPPLLRFYVGVRGKAIDQILTDALDPGDSRPPEMEVFEMMNEAIEAQKLDEEAIYSLMEKAYNLGYRMVGHI